jgi:hypothetical protein
MAVRTCSAQGRRVRRRHLLRYFSEPTTLDSKAQVFPRRGMALAMEWGDARTGGPSGVGVPTINHTVSTLRFFFRVMLKRQDTVEHTLHPRAAQAASGAQRARSGVAARCRAGAEVQGGAATRRP